MNTFFFGLENLLDVIWRISWQASVLAALLMLLTALMRLPARARCLLWTLVLLRLLLPVLPESRWSLFNWLSRTPEPAAHPSVVYNTSTPGNSSASANGIEIYGPSKSQNKYAAITATPAATPASAWQLGPILAVIWFVGTLVMLGAVVIASLRLRRLLKDLRPLHNPTIQNVLDSCAEELSVRRNIPLYVTDALNSPALVSFWRPRLVLPAAFCEEFSAAEWRLVFLHELNHHKRGDIPLNYLLAFLRALHWFNPILHVFLNRWHNDRELACDEAVMARLEDPRSYGQTILKLVQALAGPRRATVPGVVGILEFNSLTKRRMAMIASFRPRSRWVALGCVVLLGAVGCVAMTDAVASDKAPAPAQVQMKAAGETSSTPLQLAQANSSQSRRTSPAPAPGAAPASDAAIDNALNKPLSFVNTGPLEQSLEFMADALDVNMVVDWPALGNAGVNKDASIQLKISKPIPARKLLELILHQASPELGFAVDSGVLQIGTAATLNDQRVIRAYAIDDLLEAKSNSIEAKADDKTNARANDLFNTIISTVAQESWRANGGTIGDLRFFNGKMIVKTTPAIHEEISHLLKILREGDKSK